MHARIESAVVLVVALLVSMTWVAAVPADAAEGDDPNSPILPLVSLDVNDPNVETPSAEIPIFVTAINGIPIEELILGTTTARIGQQERADNFDVSSMPGYTARTNTENPPENLVITMFDVPVSQIFVLEKDGNDDCTVTLLDAGGETLGDEIPFASSAWAITQTSEWLVGGISIQPPAAIYGIQIFSTGVDVLSVSAVPAKTCGWHAPDNSVTSDVWINLNEATNYTARHECSFVQAGDRFIMFGGRESARKLDKYDFCNNSWSSGGAQAPKEFNHFQATFYGGFVWVVGSFKTNNFPRELPEENIWLYHPPTDKWIKGPSIPSNRRRGGAGLVVYQDKFYLVGGNTIGHNGGYVDWFDEYDPTNNTWTVLEDAPEARDHFHAAVIDDTLYAAGGRLSGGPGGVFSPLVSKVDAFNFTTQTWTQLANDLPTPRAAPGTAVFKQELYIMGGEGTSSGPAYKRVEAYDPNAESWSRKADMNYARHGTQAIVSGNGIFIAAGSPNRGGGRQRNMEAYSGGTPAGVAVTASKLVAPAEISIATGTVKSITLDNTGGNSGSFIQSVTLAGDGSSKFQSNSNVALTFVYAHGQLAIEIEHLGDAAGDEADLQIVYNGGMEKTIKLVSH